MGRTVFIVLFRGVGGATQLPTQALREALTDDGFQDVATYINSGNAIVGSDKGAAAVAERIAAIARARFGFSKDIMVVQQGEWARLVRENPFPEAEPAPTTLHAFTLASPPDERAVTALQAMVSGRERLAARGRFVYFHSPDGFGISKLPPRLEKTLNVAATARNWRTVLKLDALAAAAAAAAG